MRAEGLVYLHVVLAMTLVGALLAIAVLAAGAESREYLRRLAWRTALLAAAASVATAVVGEVTRARSSVDGTWLDVGSSLAYAGLVLPGLALAALAWFALERPPLARWVATLASAMVVVGLATAFLMAAKPA